MNNSPIGISATDVDIDLTKTLAWKDEIVERLNSGVLSLLKKAKTRFVSGAAHFIDGKTVQVISEDGMQTISAQNIVIATGSLPTALSALPFGGDIINSTQALSLAEIPYDLAIVGGGYIGLEIGTALAKLGSNVTIVEFADSILPQYDAKITKLIVKRLKKLGVTILTGTSAKEFSTGELQVEKPDGEIHSIKVDKVLVTVGRSPKTDGVGLDEISLTMNGPFIQIDDKCQTSMRGIYAIGDVTGDPMLAHRAMAQGEMVAEIVAGKSRIWDKTCIPAVCFTDPEIVDCGMSEAIAKKEGIETVTGIFPFAANARAMTMEHEEGFVRVLARADNKLILGLQAVGGGVSELSAAFSIAIEMGARLDDISAIIHAHPTQSEGLQEACLKALGNGIHI